jgi:TLC domain
MADTLQHAGQPQRHAAPLLTSGTVVRPHALAPPSVSAFLQQIPVVPWPRASATLCARMNGTGTGTGGRAGVGVGDGAGAGGAALAAVTAAAIAAAVRSGALAGREAWRTVTTTAAGEGGLLVTYAALGIPLGAALAALLWAALLLPAAALSAESRSYRSLPRAARVEWLSRVISDIHAVFVTAGLYVAIFCEPPAGLHAYTSSGGGADGGVLADRLLLFRVVLTLELGYFIYDSLLVLCMHATISSPLETLAHHAVVMLGTAYVLNIDKPLAYVWGSGMFLTEASTPFVNQRWFMAIRHRHQKRYKATGLLMTVAFILARPLGIPVFLWWMWHQPELLASLDPATVREITTVGVLGCSALYGLNVYWTLLIVRGLIRALLPGRDSSNRNPRGQEGHAIPREEVKAS